MSFWSDPDIVKDVVYIYVSCIPYEVGSGWLCYLSTQETLSAEFS